MEVHGLERYELVRRSVLVSGMSEREASREFGVNRRTVSKMLENPVPPGYRLKNPRPKPKLGPHLARIARIVKEDEQAPRKQRHTARRIYERLRDEDGYAGGPCQVGRAVKALRARQQETFIPLAKIPGEAEADFGEAWADVAGVRCRGHAFFMVLPFSDVWYLQIYPEENAESFCDGNVRSFRFFGGTPNRIVYDNAGYAVKPQGRALTGRERVLAQAFAELRSACLFEAEFAAPRKGNEKGSVERHVATLRSRLLVPVPKADSWEELNTGLHEAALRNKSAKAEALGKEAAAFLPLADYEPCRLTCARADKLGLVRFEGCSYSVPPKAALRPVFVRSTPFRLEILSAKEVVAEHDRCFEKGRVNPKLEHYIDVLEYKARAARRALPVLEAGLPDVFELYRRKVADGTGVGDRKFVAVLRLSLEFGPERVAEALRLALAGGGLDPADIRLRVLKEAEPPPASCCMTWKLPGDRKSPAVERPPLSEYTRLLSGAVR